MRRTVAYKIFLFAFLATFQTSESIPREGFRIERSNEDPPEDGASTDASIEEICGPPDSRRKRRSEPYLFDASAPNGTSVRTTTNASHEMTNDGMHEGTTNGTYETTDDGGATVDISHLSAEFLNCTHIYLERECYEVLPDGSVLVPLYDKKVFPRSDYLINDDLLFVCPDFFNKTEGKKKFSSHLAIISIVGSSISTFCLVLHIVVYFSIKTAKNLPSRCLLSLCIALLCAYCFTFLETGVTGETSCRVVGMSMVYFFLASFFWMNVFSYDVWRSIRLATTKLRLTADRPVMVRFVRYSLYAWGSPLMIVLLAVIVHHSTLNVKYQLVFGPDICWFAHKQALALYFAGPLFFLLAVNVLFTVGSFVMISTAAMKSSAGGGKVGFDLWSRFFLSLRLGSSMGLTWIFGVLAIVTRVEWLWYLFAICSALQGVFIFCSFTVSERSRKQCRKVLKSRKFSTVPTQVSSQATSSV